ncbi:MAG: transposase [Phycisphaerae bacterium]|nr:transposase [Phycisphaerae bacterium]
MGRPARITEPGVVYHLLNRRVMRLKMFRKDRDYEAFEQVLLDALRRPDAPSLLAYCLMPNHWHLVVRARAKTDLSTWMQWLTVTHTHRWHTHYRRVGEGPLYQGRFKSVPVQEDGHFLTLCRYVEANPVRAGLVPRAEEWQWSSLWVRENGPADLRAALADWPVDRPRGWRAAVNRDVDEESEAEVRKAITRGTPLGTAAWIARTAARLGLQTTLRPRGRPRKAPEKSS